MIETTLAIICDYCKIIRYDAKAVDMKAKQVRSAAHHDEGWAFVNAGDGWRDRCPACKGVSTGTKAP